jgi:hypothetical protein
MDNQALPNCLPYFPLEQLLLYSEIGILDLFGRWVKCQIGVFDKAIPMKRCGQVQPEFLRTGFTGSSIIR